MNAKSINGASPEAIALALKDAMANGYAPTLAIVFISIAQDRKAVSDLLVLHGIQVIGATSSGEFINEQQTNGQIVIMLLDVDKTYFSILFTDTHDRELSEAVLEIAGKAMAAFTRPALIMCSTCFSSTGHVFNGQELVKTMGNAMGNSVEIFGGMAGDDVTMTGTYVFTANDSTDEGLALLVLDADKIKLRGIALSGWKPLGKVRTVTKSEADWIYTIDDQPALEMYLRYLGETLNNAKDEQKTFIEDISFHYPFLCIDAGDPVIRTPLAIDEEKNAIKIDSPMTVGQQLQFTVPPDFDIVETVLDNAKAIRNEDGMAADALLVFSCMGRLSALGPMAQEENDGLAKVWDAPMAGFFSYGEFGKGMNKRHEYHSTTCCWVAIQEI